MVDIKKLDNFFQFLIKIVKKFLKSNMLHSEIHLLLAIIQKLALIQMEI